MYSDTNFGEQSSFPWPRETILRSLLDIIPLNFVNVWSELWDDQIKK